MTASQYPQPRAGIGGRLFSGQGLIGGLIVLVGVLLLAETTGLYDTRVLLQFVPSLFVLAGIYAIVASRLRNLAGPIVLIIIAGAVQLVTLEIIAASDVLSLWPILIIAAGLSMLLGHYRSATRPVSAAEINAFALLGGNEPRATGPTFTGGSLTAILGGIELDLREATVEEGPARIDATALFGGIDIAVPADWNVQVEIMPILGGVEDSRPVSRTDHDDVDLLVTGFVAFGGVEITN